MRKKRYVITFSLRSGKGERVEYEPSFKSPREARRTLKRLKNIYGSGFNPRIKLKKVV